MSRVYLSRCNDYIREDVYEAVDRIFEMHGGIDKIVNKGEKIFLKLNLIMKKSPEYAATTHPLVVEAVAKKLVDFGCKVIIGDSPGGPYTERILKGLYKACGIEEAAENAGASLNFDCSSMEVSTPEGCTVKRITMIKPPFNCDKVISISKLKTHCMALFSGSVKVLFGMVPGVIKAEYHFKMPDIKDFSNLLVDICETLKPSFSIIDGIIGMEGEGPTAGNPKHTGLIIASDNPYDIDVAASYIIGLNPMEVPTIKRCVERNLSKGSIEDIDIIGEDINENVKKYITPIMMRSINFLNGIFPKRIEEFLTMYLAPKPTFSYDICVKCGDCMKSCPADAIEMSSGKPIVNLKDCIRCFCCQELCPKKAVIIKRPWFTRKFLKSK